MKTKNKNILKFSFTFLMIFQMIFIPSHLFQISLNAATTEVSMQIVKPVRQENLVILPSEHTYPQEYLDYLANKETFVPTETIDEETATPIETEAVIPETEIIPTENVPVNEISLTNPINNTSSNDTTSSNSNTQSTTPAQTDSQKSISLVSNNNNTGTNSENNSVTVDSNTNSITNNNDFEGKQNTNIKEDTGNNTNTFINGNTETSSGNINTEVTLITTANSNVTSDNNNPKIATLNIYDDYEGDINFTNSEPIYPPNDSYVYDYQIGDLSSINDTTGANSENNAYMYQTDFTEIENFNTADLDNTVNINLSTGNNKTSNVNGDSTIETGDINLAVNTINFVNSTINTLENIAVEVINIFGTFIGDIILPNESNIQIASSDQVKELASTNTSTGSESTNSATAESIESTEITNENNLKIDNGINIEATTGDNTLDAINGNTEIVTGNIYEETTVVNVGNQNLNSTNTADANNWWLVIINELGNWTGQLLGLDSSGNTISNYDFYATDLTSLNSQTNAYSQNEAFTSDENILSINNNNQASIDNEINITANTGNNTFANNNGNNNLTTGDINIFTNMVNFANFNYTGLNWGLLIINVFGEWIGDITTPSYLAAQKNNPEVSESPIQKAETTNNLEDNKVGNYIHKNEITKDPTPSEKDSSTNSLLDLKPIFHTEIATPTNNNKSDTEIAFANATTDNYQAIANFKSPMASLITTETGSSKAVTNDKQIISNQTTNPPINTTIHEEIASDKTNNLLKLAQTWYPLLLVAGMSIVVKKRIF